MPFDISDIISIIQKVRDHGAELPWVECKRNNADPQEIGEYVSALANTAALYNQNYGFVIWGVADETHEIVGTSFDPTKAKKGNQSLELWISTQLEPQVQFFFHNTMVENEDVVLLEIAAAYSTPVKFRDIEYIRIGSNKKKLKDFPDTERQLWAIFSRKTFEEAIAADNLPSESVLRLLDYPKYFEMISVDLPSNRDGIIERLQNEKLITRNDSGSFAITNLGALLYAKQLSSFSPLDRKAVRVIRYNGDDRISAASKEIVGNKGYANGFEDLIDHIMSMVPDNEYFELGIRKTAPTFPEEAIRELVGNLMIHQDLHMRGTGPMVELFDTRVEITNPGPPLIDKSRFIDLPPVSRNEKMAGFLRRVGIGEERGTGYDKIVFQTELYKLPPPEIMVYDTHTRVTLFAHKPYAKLSKRERQQACYLHACLMRIYRKDMTNSTLRERFGVEEKNSSMISRLLKDTCDAGLIKLSDDSIADKNRKYLPFWA